MHNFFCVYHLRNFVVPCDAVILSGGCYAAGPASAILSAAGVILSVAVLLVRWLVVKQDVARWCTL